ncbi:uncharacterized protein [Dermacentor andersoni]|uniref:uncharacterized protein n=1 Tax=Dermacentor andersoni TaxID=34620 RepID=UPI003B3BD196
MAHHQLPEYDDQSGNWKAYIMKAEAYFEATGISDSGKKRALLVAALSTRTVQLLSGQVAPRKLNSLTYEEAVKVLDDYFDPKRHEITESYRFFNRCQLEGSSCTPAMHAVLSEFKDVFSPELGITDGHPVHLKLKEGATPKLYHKPLEGLFREDRPTPIMAAARIQRWSLLLGAYQYKIEYEPGSDNLNADALCRLPLETTEELHECVHSLQQLDDTPLSLQAMRQLTAKDQADEGSKLNPGTPVWTRNFGEGEI